MIIRKPEKIEFRRIKFPGTDQDLILRSITRKEIREIIQATREHLRKKTSKINSIALDALEHEATIQTLFRAMRDPEDPGKPFAASADEVRNLLTVAEKDILTREHNKIDVWWNEQLTFQEIKKATKHFGSFGN